MNISHQNDSHGEHAVILFDGICNLCNSSVQFIIRRDPKRYFKFTALQSDAAQSLLRRYRIDPNTLYSILVLDHGILYERSDAALYIARHLSGLWPILTIFRILPKKLRDVFYNYIATHRYTWFGQRDSCMLPTPDLKSRFLN